MTDMNIEKLFGLPARELKVLSFSKTDKSSIEKWAATLPALGMSKSSQVLLEAMQEINSLLTTPSNRMDIIEALKPSISRNQTILKKSFINQPIILPEPAQKVADLSSKLQTQLTTAYLITACQCVEKMDSIFKKPSQLLAESYFLYAQRKFSFVN